MIFVTVGTQLPFNRLIREVDRWARSRGRKDIFAQIGKTDWKPSYIHWEKFLNPADFRKEFKAADAIVAHAGMGTIIAALEFGKPVVVMPRLATLKEHRSDHQIVTAKRFRDSYKVTVALNESELWMYLDKVDTIEGSQQIDSSAEPRLLSTIRDFVNNA